MTDDGKGAMPLDEVLGGQTDSARFETFLASWESILNRRVEETVRLLASVDGVRGIILAGSVGRGEPWPLSDIDLLPIYDDERFAAVQAEVERRRLTFLQRWLDEGWWSGLDVGRLAFSRDEVAVVVGPNGPPLTSLLQDDRWYHSLDKGYRGRAIFDPLGLASALANWLTKNRFHPTVVQTRFERARRETHEALRCFESSITRSDPLAATTAARLVVKWLQIRLLESWGERDNSFGRIGTRFERAASARGQSDLAGTLNALSDLDDRSVDRRMNAAPAWVRERHDRSWRARQRVGEEVTRTQDARDVLRVCSHYELRGAVASPFPEWLAIPAGPEQLPTTLQRLASVADRCFGTERRELE